MKTELKAKFLQHLNQKKHDQGFTLIELLVVIIIIGILSAIALPSFLNQANKAKQSEAKQYVGSMNRAQQAFYLEKGGFSTEISLLGLGIKTDTVNYAYKIHTSASVGSSGYYPKATNLGLSKVDVLRSYAGGVASGYTEGATGEATTLASLCESKDVGDKASQTYEAAIVNNAPACPDTTDWDFIK
jgi:prepilin-type N-terminal cleavage/methylation domain-containing protein